MKKLFLLVLCGMSIFPNCSADEISAKENQVEQNSMNPYTYYVKRQECHVFVHVGFVDGTEIQKEYTIVFTYKDVPEARVTYMEYKGYTEYGVREKTEVMPLDWRAYDEYIRSVFCDFQVRSIKYGEIENLL